MDRDIKAKKEDVKKGFNLYLPISVINGMKEEAKKGGFSCPSEWATAVYYAVKNESPIYTNKENLGKTEAEVLRLEEKEEISEKGDIEDKEYGIRYNVIKSFYDAGRHWFNERRDDGEWSERQIIKAEKYFYEEYDIDFDSEEFKNIQKQKGMTTEKTEVITKSETIIDNDDDGWGEAKIVCEICNDVLEEQPEKTNGYTLCQSCREERLKKKTEIITEPENVEVIIEKPIDIIESKNIESIDIIEPIEVLYRFEKINKKMYWVYTCECGSTQLKDTKECNECGRKHIRKVYKDV